MRLWMPWLRAAPLLLSLIAAGCGSPSTRGAEQPPVTTATPPAGPFNGSVTVTLKTNEPATILATIDGADPHVISATRLVGQNTLEIPLTQTTTINYFARTDTGVSEKLHSEQWVRAGGVVGTASGVIVVGAVATNETIGLLLDGNVVQTFPALTEPGQIPFHVTGLASGMHTFQAAADRLGTGNFIPVLDYYSPSVPVTIDTADPFHASAENIQLLLGVSSSDLCTIEGTIDVPASMLGQSVSVNALSAGNLLGALGGLGGLGGGGTGGAGATGAQQLLTQLLGGYQVFALPGTTKYPYAVTNLQPGQYVVIPSVSGIGAGGLGIDFMVNPLSPINCTAGAVVEKNFAFGASSVGGSVSVNTSGSMSGFAYGIVVARSFDLLNGIQAVLMPTILLPGSGGTPTGAYGGVGLVDGQQFSERAYTSLDPSNSGNPLAAAGPLLSALLWAVNPISTDPAQATFTANGTNVTENLTTP